MNARVLVSCAKQDFGPRLREACAVVRTAIAARSDVEVVPADEVPWERVRHEQGSWEGSYRWSARSFTSVVLVETTVGALSRGVFQIAEEFFRVGKKVAVARDGKLMPVRAVRLSGMDDWQQNYGTAIV